ncbi:adenylate kinase [Capsaspora owczarzaki ATCC 30864]|uniref:Adenylate kinase n=1 Tax=Capsaspora owczarzaki (strain ATCC 30864) TaxID=595528 RepID=A0A0D2WLN7_CAPO3|nr:adenylate kinase [Capsaspora owczarzaki ATCC 30864]
MLRVLTDGRARCSNRLVTAVTATALLKQQQQQRNLWRGGQSRCASRCAVEQSGAAICANLSNQTCLPMTLPPMLLRHPIARRSAAPMRGLSLDAVASSPSSPMRQSALPASIPVITPATAARTNMRAIPSSVAAAAAAAARMSPMRALSTLGTPSAVAGEPPQTANPIIHTPVDDFLDKVPTGGSSPDPQPASPATAEVADPEIKDPAVIFQTVWLKLEAEMTVENMCFPKEIIWLNGAPGSGKGTNTPFILSARGISAPAIVLSDMLRGPEFQAIIDRGEMISDKYVVEVLFRTLLKPQYRLGAVVDGFPRTPVQVECIKLLFDKMMALRKQFLNTELAYKFPRPIFRIAILYVSEKESLERQLARGQKVKEHNQRVLDDWCFGYGTALEERATDFDEKLIAKRYGVFKQNYDTLLAMREHFAFYLINAQGSIANVQHSILKQFEYQSSQELNQETNDSLQQLPLATDIAINARQQLVRRLDTYQATNNETFVECIKLIDREFMPLIRRSAFSGSVLIRSENPRLGDSAMVDMILDVMAERGFSTQFDVKVLERPIRVDPATMEIVVASKTYYNLFIKFPGAKLRERVETLTG